MTYVLYGDYGLRYEPRSRFPGNVHPTLFASRNAGSLVSLNGIRMPARAPGVESQLPLPALGGNLLTFALSCLALSCLALPCSVLQ